jgi:beta-lactamase regulating signal transducer with metallopeptidase domain
VDSILCLALSNAVMATLLAALVAVLTRFCRRPAVRHALWLLVLLKLLTPPLLSLPVLGPRMPEVDSPHDETVDAFAEELPSITEPPQPMEAISEPSEQSAPLPSEPSAPSWTAADVLMPVALALWLGGSLVWWTIAGVRLARFHRLLHQARIAPVEVQQQARRLAVLLGLCRCPPVLFVSAPLSPLLWALGFAPRLLIPSTLWQRLTAKQQDTLLAHELAHLRRRDHWIRRLEFVVLGLYWWHPVAWWARRRLQEAEEECCDALVVALLPDAAPAYAAAMVETVAFLAQTRAASLLGASGAGQVPLLKRRLTMILSETPSRRPTRAGFWIVLGMGALLLPLAPGAAKPDASEPESPQETKRQAADTGRDLMNDPGVDPHLKLHVLAAGMQNCLACHAAQTVHERDLQRKPQSWQEAHDEIIRLMDEVRSRQAQLREAANRLPAIAPPDRAEEIEKLKDEIELLKLQVRLKQAHLRSTNTQQAEAGRRYEGLLQTNRKAPGSIPIDDVMAAETKYKTLEAEIEVKEVELQEALVRLKQAERRLARLQPKAERPTQPTPQKAASGDSVTAPEKPYFHNFGTVKQGTILKHRFPVKNANDYPIRINRVRTSAGCLMARAEKEKIPPGEEAMIDIELDTGRFQNTKAFTVWVDLQEGRWVMPAIFRVVSEPQPPATAAGTSNQDKQAQLRELESKVEKLMKEIHDLRREMQPEKKP